MGKKSDRAVNPADAHRKKMKQREIKKNKEQRRDQRVQLMKQKNPERLMAELKRVQKAEIEGNMDDKMRARKKLLVAAHAEAVKRQQEQKEEEERTKGQKEVVVKGLGRIIGKQDDHEDDAKDDEDNEDEDVEMDEYQILAKQLDEDEPELLSAPPGMETVNPEQSETSDAVMTSATETAASSQEIQDSHAATPAEAPTLTSDGVASSSAPASAPVKVSGPPGLSRPPGLTGKARPAVPLAPFYPGMPPAMGPMGVPLPPHVMMAVPGMPSVVPPPMWGAPRMAPMPPFPGGTGGFFHPGMRFPSAPPAQYPLPVPAPTSQSAPSQALGGAVGLAASGRPVHATGVPPAAASGLPRAWGDLPAVVPDMSGGMEESGAVAQGRRSRAPVLDPMDPNPETAPALDPHHAMNWRRFPGGMAPPAPAAPAAQPAHPPPPQPPAAAPGAAAGAAIPGSGAEKAGSGPLRPPIFGATASAGATGTAGASSTPRPVVSMSAGPSMGPVAKANIDPALTKLVPTKVAVRSKAPSQEELRKKAALLKAAKAKAATGAPAGAGATGAVSGGSQTGSTQLAAFDEFMKEIDDLEPEPY